MKYKFFSLYIILFFAFLFGTKANFVLAAPTPTDPNVVSLENPISATNPISVIGLVIKSALTILGALTLLMIVFGARKWLWSAGNAESIESGTKTILWAVLGLILTLGSYVVLSSILKYFGGAGTGAIPK